MPNATALTSSPAGSSGLLTDQEFGLTFDQVMGPASTSWSDAVSGPRPPARSVVPSDGDPSDFASQYDAATRNARPASRGGGAPDPRFAAHYDAATGQKPLMSDQDVGLTFDQVVGTDEAPEQHADPPATRGNAAREMAICMATSPSRHMDSLWSSNSSDLIVAQSVWTSSS